MTAQTAEAWMGDAAGRFVSDWSLVMHNTGFSKMESEMAKMLRLGAWQDFTDALGHWRFLPGEFDYFLSSQDIHREHVIQGLRDIKLKAEMERAMDERKTGDDEYRRDLETVRKANPRPMGTQIEPYGYRLRDKPGLLNRGIEVGADATKGREPLGSQVRRYTRTGGQVSRPQTYTSKVDMLTKRAKRLPDHDLDALIKELIAEQGRRAVGKAAGAQNGKT